MFDVCQRLRRSTRVYRGHFARPVSYIVLCKCNSQFNICNTICANVFTIQCVIYANVSKYNINRGRCLCMYLCMCIYMYMYIRSCTPSFSGPTPSSLYHLLIIYTMFLILGFWLGYILSKKWVACLGRAPLATRQRHVGGAGGRLSGCALESSTHTW